MGSIGFQAKSFSYLSRLALIKQQRLTAFKHLRQCVNLSFGARKTNHIHENFVAFADYCRIYGSIKKAVEVLSYVKHSHLTEKRDKGQAQELLNELKSKLSKEEFDTAVKRSQGLELETVMQEALAFLEEESSTLSKAD